MTNSAAGVYARVGGKWGLFTLDATDGSGVQDLTEVNTSKKLGAHFGLTAGKSARLTDLVANCENVLTQLELLLGGKTQALFPGNVTNGTTGTSDGQISPGVWEGSIEIDQSASLQAETAAALT